MIRRVRVTMAGMKFSIFYEMQISEPTRATEAMLFRSCVEQAVLDDDRKACSYGMRGVRFFIESLSRYYLGGTRPTGRLDVPRDSLSDSDLDEAMRLRNTEGSQLTTITGDPACAHEYVERWKEIDVDELILVMQMRTVPHELIMESLKTFAEKVMPHFA